MQQLEKHLTLRHQQSQRNTKLTAAATGLSMEAYPSTVRGTDLWARVLVDRIGAVTALSLAVTSKS